MKIVEGYETVPQMPNDITESARRLVESAFPSEEGFKTLGNVYVADYLYRYGIGVSHPQHGRTAVILNGWSRTLDAIPEEELNHIRQLLSTHQAHVIACLQDRSKWVRGRTALEGNEGYDLSWYTGDAVGADALR